MTTLELKKESEEQKQHIEHEERPKDEVYLNCLLIKKKIFYKNVFYFSLSDCECYIFI